MIPSVEQISRPADGCETGQKQAHWRGRTPGSIIFRWREYLTNPDPLAHAAGMVAMVVAVNQPFYPLYLHAIVGAAAWPAWLTLLTTPFFAAIPAVARRHSLTGRAMLPVVGVVNTMLCVKLFGLTSTVELFLLPCILLAAILFRPAERAVMAPILLIPFVAYMGLDSILSPPLQVFSAEEYRSIVAVHAVSVASLTAFIGLLFVTILSERKV